MFKRHYIEIMPGGITPAGGRTLDDLLSAFDTRIEVFQSAHLVGDVSALVAASTAFKTLFTEVAEDLCEARRLRGLAEPTRN